jgi:hypothetical protein
MSVHIDEVTTTVEARAGGGDGGSASGGSLPGEARIEELRPLVRALVAEEIERLLRCRGVMP